MIIGYIITTGFNLGWLEGYIPSMVKISFQVFQYFLLKKKVGWQNNQICVQKNQDLILDKGPE